MLRPDDERVGYLVSVIVPVRNGALTLSLVLEGLLGQTYGNTEILISDNASTDATPALCREACARDERVCYVRHERPLTAAENFRYWIDRAKGRFVMFAAHDDLRDARCIELCVQTLRRTPSAVCALPRTFSFSRYSESPFKVLDPVSCEMRGYETRGRHFLSRLGGFVNLNGIPVYGLLRTEAVRAYPWYDLDYAPDLPFVLFLAWSGEFEVVGEASFFYFKPLEEKLPEERSLANSLRPLRPFPEVRLAWACGKALSVASNGRYKIGVSFICCCTVAMLRQWARLAGRVYGVTPAPVRQAWRRVKSILGFHLN